MSATTLPRTGAITVITYDGRLPKDGGKRMAYMADGLVSPIGSSLDSLFAAVRAQKAAAAPAPILVEPIAKLLVFAEIPRMQMYCSGCNEWVGRSSWRLESRETDKGKITAYICPFCSTVHR